MTLRSLCLGREKDISADELYDTLITDASTLKHAFTEQL